MACHALVNTEENKHIIDLVQVFMTTTNPLDKIPFERYLINGEHIKRGGMKDDMLIFQILTDRDEEEDDYVVSVFCTTGDRLKIKVDGEWVEGAIAEVHIKTSGETDIYCVI